MRSAPPHSFHAALPAGLTWDLACDWLATEKAYRRIRPSLIRFLKRNPVRVLPGGASPEFLERPSYRPSVRRVGDPLSVYLADLGRLRPTLRQDEFVLARLIDLLRSSIVERLGKRPPQAAVAILRERLSQYSPVLEALHGEDAEIRPIARPLPDAMRDDLHRWVADLHRAQEALITRNLHLVPAAARRYRGLGVSLMDLIQDGNAALLRAVERYDRLRKVRFSSYAPCWIQQGILKSLYCNSRTVRLPVYLGQALHRIHRQQSTTPEPLTVEELSERIHEKPERVDRAIRADRACLSIDMGTPNEDFTLRDTIQGNELVEDSITDLPEGPGLKQRLEELLHTLPTREARVLVLRYGLMGNRVHTLEEVGQAFSVSRERARQLQGQALRRLAKPETCQYLAPFLG